MNINDLHPKLKKPYLKTAECGVVKIKDSKYPNLYFVVPPPPPIKVVSGFSITKVSAAMSALHKLPAFDEMDDLDKLINYLFVRREAVESSRLEGTWSTIDEVLSPLEDHFKNSDAALSVRGYAHSLESLFDQAYAKKEKVFNLKNIKMVHKEMMSRDSHYFGIPGEIRSPGKSGAVVYIGGGNRPEESIYNPTPPEYVKMSLQKVLDWFMNNELAERGDAGLGMVLPIRMGVGHSHFEAVHPFTDGNGRVGRALWPLQMIASGVMPLYLSGYVEKEKHTYIHALESAQKKLDYSKIIDFISSAILSCSIEMKNTKEKLFSLPSIWESRGNFRKNSAAHNALAVMLKMPIFTMEGLRAELGCSAQASATAIKILIKEKIIKERTGHKRNRIFAAEEVIALLAREHGSDADLALESAHRILKIKN